MLTRKFVAGVGVVALAAGTGVAAWWWMNRRRKVPSSSRRSITVKPFRGWRPPAELTKRVVSPPYDVLNRKEAMDFALDNPQSFLHINKPEIDRETDEHDDGYYDMAAKNLKTFMEKGWLVKDEAPCYYVYAQRMGEHTQYGIVGGASTRDYADGLIKCHEKTRKPKEDDRTRIVDAQNANAGPVFLMWKDADSERLTQYVGAYGTTKSASYV
jgi:uncharacterized protein (DUF1015 family)